MIKDIVDEGWEEVGSFIDTSDSNINTLVSSDIIQGNHYTIMERQFLMTIEDQVKQALGETYSPDTKTYIVATHRSAAAKLSEGWQREGHFLDATDNESGTVLVLSKAKSNDNRCLRP
ncbi:MAG: hypothetical protein GY737_00380 [Desulfobacteraceae bacterium]|nr:hypothetical protein [Desulfobacteraceae bacterium]